MRPSIQVELKQQSSGWGKAACHVTHSLSMYVKDIEKIDSLGVQSWTIRSRNTSYCTMRLEEGPA